MAHCTNCGAQLPEGKLTCPSCGARVPASEYPGYDRYDSAYRPPRSEGGYASPEPLYVYADEDDGDERPVSVWGYVWSLFVLRLPIIGFIVQVVWSLGAARNRNRRNLAVACLIYTVIGLVLLIVAAYLIWTYVINNPAFSAWLGEYLTELMLDSMLR